MSGIACTTCGTTQPRPADGQWAPLWDAGWRWLGAQRLYSCPVCPPVTDWRTSPVRKERQR